MNDGSLRTMQVEIGRYTNTEAKELLYWTGPYRMTGWGIKILEKTIFAQNLQTLTVVIVTATELCGNREATLAEIFATGLRRGWEKCPTEVGPALREQYQDQPEGEELHIVMDPIETFNDEIEEFGLDVFKLSRDGNIMCLSGGGGHPDHRPNQGIPIEVCFAFVLPNRP